MLQVWLVFSLAKAWAGDWEIESDTRLSLLKANNLDALRQRDVRVHCILGSYDILTPDAMSFRDRLIESGVKGKWLLWEKLMHCWVISAGFGSFTTELEFGWQWILDVLGETVKQS
jgi:acetyl esterase/lipase